MKQVIYCLLLTSVVLITLSACATPPYSSEKATPLVGEISKQALFANNELFRNNFLQANVSENDKKLIKRWPENLHIDIFFATWCHDSQREVPVLLNILEQRPKLPFKLIALDEYKSDRQGLSNNKGVKYTPTIIIYINHKEVGRIIERPQIDLVSDITNLLKLEII